MKDGRPSSLGAMLYLKVARKSRGRGEKFDRFDGSNDRMATSAGAAARTACALPPDLFFLLAFTCDRLIVPSSIYSVDQATGCFFHQLDYVENQWRQDLRGTSWSSCQFPCRRRETNQALTGADISVVPVFLLSLPTTKPPSGDRGRIICPAPAAAYLVVLLAPNLPITDPSHRILIEKE